MEIKDTLFVVHFAALTQVAPYLLQFGIESVAVDAPTFLAVEETLLDVLKDGVQVMTVEKAYNEIAEMMRGESADIKIDMSGQLIGLTPRGRFFIAEACEVEAQI